MNSLTFQRIFSLTFCNIRCAKQVQLSYKRRGRGITCAFLLPPSFVIEGVALPPSHSEEQGHLQLVLAITSNPITSKLSVLILSWALQFLPQRLNLRSHRLFKVFSLNTTIHFSFSDSTSLLLPEIPSQHTDLVTTGTRSGLFGGTAKAMHICHNSVSNFASLDSALHFHPGFCQPHPQIVLFFA